MRWSSFLIEDRVSSSRGRYRRRLIKLIFAGRNRIIMIGRELPLTTTASPARPVANVRRGFSFPLAPAAADLVLELNCFVQGFCFVFHNVAIEELIRGSFELPGFTTLHKE